MGPQYRQKVCHSITAMLSISRQTSGCAPWEVYLNKPLQKEKMASSPLLHGRIVMERKTVIFFGNFYLLVFMFSCHCRVQEVKVLLNPQQ